MYTLLAMVAHTKHIDKPKSTPNWINNIKMDWSRLSGTNVDIERASFQ